jgi:hypothetical protein
MVDEQGSGLLITLVVSSPAAQSPNVTHRVNMVRAACNSSVGCLHKGARSMSYARLGVVTA